MNGIQSFDKGQYYKTPLHLRHFVIVKRKYLRALYILCSDRHSKNMHFYSNPMEIEVLLILTLNSNFKTYRIKVCGCTGLASHHSLYPRHSVQHYPAALFQHCTGQEIQTVSPEFAARISNSRVLLHNVDIKVAQSDYTGQYFSL